MSRNRAYPWGCRAILDQSIDLVADTLSLQLVDETFTFDETHEYLADVPTGEKLGARTAVSGTRSYVGSTLYTNAPFTAISAVSATPDDVGGVLLVGPGASDAVRTLLYCWQRGVDRTPIVVVTDGGNVNVEFIDGVILTLGG